jgi:hypothetical protein
MSSGKRRRAASDEDGDGACPSFPTTRTPTSHACLCARWLTGVVGTGAAGRAAPAATPTPTPVLRVRLTLSKPTTPAAPAAAASPAAVRWHRHRPLSVSRLTRLTSLLCRTHRWARQAQPQLQRQQLAETRP